MAINKIYFAEFTDVRGNEYRVDIYKNPQGTITAKRFVLGEPGFTINWQGAENIFSPLLPSTCTIPFVVENSDDESFVSNLRTMSEGQYIIDIVHDPDNLERLHWRGFLTSDNLTLPDSVTPYIVELQAVDGLQTLSRRDQPEIGNRKIGQVLTDALSSIPTVDMYATTDPFLRYLVDYQPQGMSSYSGNFLDECKIAVTTLDPLTGEPSDTPTAEDAVIQVCTMLNSRLLQRRGVWTFVPMTRALNGDSTLPFTARNKNFENPTLTAGVISWQRTIESGNNRLVGNWSIAFMPPVRRVRRELNYLGNRPLAGVTFPGFDIQARINSQSSPPAAVTFTANLDSQFPADTKFTFRMRVVMEQNPSSTTTSSPLVRYRVNALVRVGNLYLVRRHVLGIDTTTVQSEFFNVGNSDQTIERPEEPNGVGWNTNTSNRVEMIGDILNSDLENGMIDGGTDTCEFELNIQTPELGSVQDVDVEMKVFAFGFGQGGGEVDSDIADAANIFCDPQLFVGTGADSDAITFAAVVDNGASEEIAIEPSSMYGESGNADSQFPAIYFGSIVGPSNQLPTGFQSSLTNSTTFINRLQCIDQLRHFQTAQEIRNGQIYTDQQLTPVDILQFDSTNWGVLNMTHTANSAIYRVELVKLSEATGPVADDGSDGVDFSTRSILPPRTRNVGSDSLRRELTVVQNQIQADILTEAGAREALRLDDLGDCDTATASTGQILQFDGTDFVAVDLPSSGPTYTFLENGRRQWSGTQDNFYHYGDSIAGSNDGFKNTAFSTLSGSNRGRFVLLNSFFVPTATTTIDLRGFVTFGGDGFSGEDLNIFVCRVHDVTSNDATLTTLQTVTITTADDPDYITGVNSTINGALSAGEGVMLIFQFPNAVISGTSYLYTSISIVVK